MFHERLKEERDRLGFTQAQLAAIGMVTTRSQQSYESKDKPASPKSEYLQNIARVGIDIHYLLFGQRNDEILNDEEKMLIKAYRNASPQVKAFMMQGAQHSINAENSQVAVGNNNIQIGNNDKK